MFGRRIFRGFLVAGVVLGFGSGFLHTAHHAERWHHAHFEDRKRELMGEFAQSCVDAARHEHERDGAHMGPHGGPQGFAPPFYGAPPPFYGAPPPSYGPPPPQGAPPPPPAAAPASPPPAVSPPAPAA